MKALSAFVRRVVAGVVSFFRWLWRQIKWVGRQIRRLIGEPIGNLFDWIVRGLKAIKYRIEAAIDWLLDIIRRAFLPGRTDRRVREARIGANGAPLLATLTLALLWYLLPLARLAGYGPTRFIVMGMGLWFVALVAWLSRCREDRRGRVARFTQGISRSTGIRRLDQMTLLLVLLLCYLTIGDLELLPLSLGSLVAVFGLLTVEHTYRPALAVPAPPAFSAGDVDEPVEIPSASGIDRELSWTVTAHGSPHRHSASVRVDRTALEDARDANSGFGEPSQIIEWVLHGTGPEVQSLAKQIHDACFRGAYSLYATVSCFVAATQAIRYVSDLESTGQEEYWRFPVETLAEGVGDCEDSAILLAALLRRAGFRCAIVIAPGHAAVAVEVPHDSPGAYFEHGGVRYYYCETTDKGWIIGEVPDGVDVDSVVFVQVPEWEEP